MMEKGISKFQQEYMKPHRGRHNH